MWDSLGRECAAVGVCCVWDSLGEGVCIGWCVLCVGQFGVCAAGGVSCVLNSLGGCAADGMCFVWDSLGEGVCNRWCVLCVWDSLGGVQQVLCVVCRTVWWGVQQVVRVVFGTV